MNQPKISIIIPVYNVEPYIAECLQSVMRQTYQGPMECIVVDDCGTDKSIEIAEQLIANYDGPIAFRVLHHEKNRGLSAARNTGTEAAIGDYVYYLDSDDFISDDCLEVLTKPLIGNEYDVVLGNIGMINYSGDVVFLPKETGLIVGMEEIFREFYVNRMLYVMAWNKLVKRSLYQCNDLSFLEGQLHEDELWTFKLVKCINTLYVQRQKTYYYRVRDTRIRDDLGRDSMKRMDSCYATLDYVLSYPAAVDKESFNKCVIYYFCVYLRNIGYNDVDFFDDYVSLRKRIDWHHLKLYFRKKITGRELKRNIHFTMHPFLGYWFLNMRRKRDMNK